MNISKASAASGISAKMIRYYESIELIPAANRTLSGYRDYTDKDVQRLIFIRRARNLGFSVDQMSQLLALWQDQARASADVKQIALDHIYELDQKLQELQAMRDTLQHLAETCQGDNRPDCPIISSLSPTALQTKPSD